MASGKTLEIRRREQITIAKSVADMDLGEPQYIGNVCPAILEEKFDRKKCSTQLDGLPVLPCLE